MRAKKWVQFYEEEVTKTACTLFLLFISKGNTIWGVPYQTFTGLFTRGPAVLRQRRTGLHAINVDSFRDYKSLSLDRKFSLNKDLKTYSVVFSTNTKIQTSRVEFYFPYRIQGHQQR